MGTVEWNSEYRFPIRQIKPTAYKLNPSGCQGAWKFYILLYSEKHFSHSIRVFPTLNDFNKFPKCLKIQRVSKTLKI